MGIIKAAAQAVGGAFADQWLEVFEADNMGDQTVFSRGVAIKKGQNTKGDSSVISNGSIIHVGENQFMLLVDGGKVVDYTAEAGYYRVDNSSMPSLSMVSLVNHYQMHLTVSNLVDRHLRNSRYSSSTYRKSKELNLEQETQLTTLICSITQNYLFVHMVHIL